jgi:DNA-directed RNA polymerase specialized sigma24 family protein
MRQGVQRLAENARQEEQSSVEAGRASRRRAAVERLAAHELTIRRTARRYSLCADDAEDAFQRALEILLTKAPTDRMRELVPWMQTVTA